MKICNKCHRYLDESCFSKRNDTKDGLSYICKECKQAYDKIFDEKKRQQARENQKYCVKCGKPIIEEQYIDGEWIISKFCKECFPDQKFKEYTCEKCGQHFKLGRKPSKINTFIIRKYCPDCSSANEERKALICPKCGKEYYAERTPDGRHFRHKKYCDSCLKLQDEKEVKCEKCGKLFIVPKYKGTNSFKKIKYCSPDCASSLTEFKDGKLQYIKKYQICKHCGKQFELNIINGRYAKRTVCDDCLKPREKAEFIEKICSICGKTFKAELTPCGSYSSTQYCSDECASIGFKTKCKETCQEKYGVDYPCQTEQALKAGNVISEINKRFAKLLDKNSIEYEQEFVLGYYAYDFKINNILIEINPTYTHSIQENHFGSHKEKYDHYNKSKIAKDNGYICLCVWDWDNWQDIINLIKQPNLKMEYVGIELIYSRGKETSKDETSIGEGFLPVYTDGFKVISLTMI